MDKMFKLIFNMNDAIEFNFKYIWMISLVAAMGGLLFGYDWVVIGGAKPFYEPFFNLTTPAMKGWATSSALVGCLVGSFSLSYTFPILNEGIGTSWTFWIYSIICFIGYLVIRKYVVETKGKSLEEIERGMSTKIKII